MATVAMSVIPTSVVSLQSGLTPIPPPRAINARNKADSGKLSISMQGLSLAQSSASMYRRAQGWKGTRPNVMRSRCRLMEAKPVIFSQRSVVSWVTRTASPRGRMCAHTHLAVGAQQFCQALSMCLWCD